MESFQKLSHNEQSEYSWWFVASHCEDVSLHDSRLSVTSCSLDLLLPVLASQFSPV